LRKTRLKKNQGKFASGEIIRSYESASFRVPLNKFRKFGSDRDATLHTYSSTRPLYDPSLPFSDIVPERGQVYIVVFRSFSGMSAWIGLTDPAIQAIDLARSEQGMLRVLGSLVSDLSTPTLAPPVPETPVLPVQSSAVLTSVTFSVANITDRQTISLAPFSSISKDIKPLRSIDSKIGKGQSAALPPVFYFEFC